MAAQPDQIAYIIFDASVRNSFMPTLFPPIEGGSIAEPIRKGVRDWRKEMTPAEVARFELVAGDLLDELGYERGSASPGPGVRLDAALRRARLEVLRAYRRARGLNSATWW